MDTEYKTRVFIIAALDNDQGICEDAFFYLMDLNSDGDYQDIINQIEGFNGQYRLVKDHTCKA